MLKTLPVPSGAASASLPLRPRFERFVLSWQFASIALCLVLALLMIVNTQMSGEAMWFWYVEAFAHGAKLYSGLHTPLQPLFVLETDVWIHIFGTRLMFYELLSLVHAAALAIGLYLVLRESPWPDFMKALTLFAVFVFTVCGHSYRFDDYHVLAEALIVYSLLALIWVVKTAGTDPGRNLRMVGLTGLVAGLTIVTRVTDGLALLVACALFLLLFKSDRRWARTGLFLAVSLLTVLVVVLLTGDSPKSYIFSTVIRAASSKGGTGGLMATPFAMVTNTLLTLRFEKRMTAILASMFLVGFAFHRRYREKASIVVLVELAVGLALIGWLPPEIRDQVRTGLPYELIVLYVTPLFCVLIVWALLRWWKREGGAAPERSYELLILVPLFEWASYAAGAAAEPLTNYYAPIAMVFLLVPVVVSWPRLSAPSQSFFAAILGMLILSGIYTKFVLPYGWQNYRYDVMFKSREAYWHPTYGPMYVDRDLLHFSERLCSDIGAVPGQPGPPLLSLPYPYPNYFCATPPWHNYVQTFFDTSTRATIEQLMRELQTAPPPWIVYQRQLNIMVGSERLYNHSQPLAQRDLDRLIMGKLASGQWTLVDRSDYLKPAIESDIRGTGWFVIHTVPTSPDDPKLPALEESRKMVDIFINQKP